jgi:hypothetical protein
MRSTLDSTSQRASQPGKVGAILISPGTTPGHHAWEVSNLARDDAERSKLTQKSRLTWNNAGLSRLAWDDAEKVQTLLERQKRQ